MDQWLFHQPYNLKKNLILETNRRSEGNYRQGNVLNSFSSSVNNIKSTYLSPVEMLGLFLSAFQILSLVAGNPLDSGRYLIDSQPLLFAEESDSDSRVINSSLVLKKKENSGGPVYYTDNREDDIVNNHHIDAEGVIWKPPYRPVSEVFSNHKG